MKRSFGRVIAFILSIALLFALAAYPSARADYVIAKGYVISNKLNMRKGPGTSFPVVDTLYREASVNIYDVDGLWLKVDAPASGTSGYVYAKHISLDGASISAYGFGVTTGKVHLREEPTSKSESLAIVPNGTSVTVYYADDYTGFYRVKVHGTLDEGFISPLYLNISSRVDPDEPDPTDKVGYINAGVVNFRTGPGTGYLVLDKLTKHTQLTILSAGIDWYKVQVHETGLSGYVFAKYVTVTNPGATPSPEPTSIPESGAGGYINGNGVNFRTGPSVTYESIGILNKDEYVWYRDVSGNWFEITVVSTRKSGWVFSKFVTFPKPTPTPAPTPVPTRQPR